MSTTLRLTWLRLLAALGVKKFVGTSCVGHRYVCHLGDFLGENPFYNSDAFRIELMLCAAWLGGRKSPVVYDVGANLGFFCTQLAQMLKRESTKIYAFEPAPETFCKLSQSVSKLALKEHIETVAAAVGEHAEAVQLSYSCKKSLFAQITPNGLNARVGDKLVYAAAFTLDEFSALSDSFPCLVKIDVEGSEVAVLRGAQNILTQPLRPAILFEFNPLTLLETGSSVGSFTRYLTGYAIYYVDDFEGQKIPFGSCVERIAGIDWVCNLFAVPDDEQSRERWLAVRNDVQSRLRGNEVPIRPSSRTLA
jgi:FkbM family methyltransferase